jgi:hypothetical protein
MKKLIYAMVGALAVISGVASGCGDSNSTTGSAGSQNNGGTNAGGSNAGGSEGGSGPSTGGTDNTGGTANTGGSGGSGGAATALSCDDYCTTITAGCTAKNLQFPDVDTCKAVCKSYPVGKVSDMGGQDSLGCRTYHAGVASMSAASADTHCWHAGPTGGDADNTDAMDGVCGGGCEAFCNLEKTACGFTGAHAQYADNATCMTACKAFKKPTMATFDVGDATAEKDYFCYFYHLTAASIDPDTHCKHTKLGGGVCEAAQN